MFFITPAQAAEEVQLTLSWVVVVGGVRTGQRIISRFVQMGIFEADSGGMGVQIAGIEVDHIAQHRVAPFFGVKCQHLGHGAAFAERVEQILRVVAVIEPRSRRRLDQGIDRHCQHVGGKRIRVYAV